MKQLVMINYRNKITFISDFKNSSSFIIISLTTHMLFLKIWFLGHLYEPNNHFFFRDIFNHKELKVFFII